MKDEPAERKRKSGRRLKQDKQEGGGESEKESEQVR